MIVRAIMKLVRKRRHQNESFRARVQMEQNAQAHMEARLKRLELIYKNKTRIK